LELVELKTDNMKLELKHLAPYLPYGLKYRLYGNFPIQKGVDNWIEDIIEINPFNFTLEKVLTYETCKPILHPLSDIHKNEFNFIYDKETDYYSINDWILLNAESRLTSKFSYEFWALLFENHFDVFGLIEQGLAVDINTLKL